MQMQSVIIYDYFRIQFYILSHRCERLKALFLCIRNKYIIYMKKFIVYFPSITAAIAVAGWLHLKCLWMLLNVYECLMVIDDY